MGQLSPLPDGTREVDATVLAVLPDFEQAELVTKDGHRNLTKFPKRLEDMIV